MATNELPKLSEPPREIILHEASLSDYTDIGRNAAESYYTSKLTDFLAPGRHEHYTHYLRGYQNRALGRMLDPRTLTVNAYEASNPHKIIGTIQAQRYVANVAHYSPR